MLTSNLWIQSGLVIGAMGTFKSICYTGGGPHQLPVAIMINFDKYTGPTFSDNTVPIIPIRHTWMEGTHTCSRLQLPIRLS